jgi:hypothetical protein
MWDLARLRRPSEQVYLKFAKQGVHASIVCLPPATHGSGMSGMLVTIALDKGCQPISEMAETACAGLVLNVKLLYHDCQSNISGYFLTHWGSM